MGKNLPNPPLELIADNIRDLWNLRMTDTKILKHLRKYHMPEGYGLGITRFREYRKALGLTSTKTQAHTVESITADMIELRQTYPRAGRAELKRFLFDEKGIKVSRALIEAWCRQYEGDLVASRRDGRLRRRRFWAAGCNDLWSCDQHDKWKRFGLGLHVCLDPFTGKVLWLKIWWGNRNPRLIFGYYLEAVRKHGYTCLVGQGDPGSENWCFAKGHTYIRHALDPSLAGTIQYRFMRRKKNIPPEIFWSNLRSIWTPGFENILEAPQRHPELRYDRDDPLQYNVFKWIFIPWLQAELDAYADGHNRKTKRRQRGKILPQGGCPNAIERYPEEFGCTNFKILVDSDATCLQEAEALYAPPDHPTFELVPSGFAKCAANFYEGMGAPTISRTNVWDIYMQLLVAFESNLHCLQDIDLQPFPREEEEEGVPERTNDEFMNILDRDIQKLNSLPDNEFEYQGGVNGGQGYDPDLLWDKEVVDLYIDHFSDEEEEEGLMDKRAEEEDSEDDEVAVAGQLLPE